MTKRPHFPEDERTSVDQFHWHEALDRAHLAIEQFDMNLLSHPVLEQNVELRQLAQEIADRLAGLYQAIGNAEPEFVSEPNKPIVEDPPVWPEDKLVGLSFPEQAALLKITFAKHTRYMTMLPEFMAWANVNIAHISKLMKDI